MDLLQEIKATLSGLIPEDCHMPEKDDFTEEQFDMILWAVQEVQEMVNRELDKQQKQFLMS
ncbi:MAG: hypothetical protein WC283_03815 [Candidatus Paceibacterota bacterium]|jgi:phage pi2 protein 07